MFDQQSRLGINHGHMQPFLRLVDNRNVVDYKSGSIRRGLRKQGNSKRESLLPRIERGKAQLGGFAAPLLKVEIGIGARAKQRHLAWGGRSEKRPKRVRCG